MFRFEMQKFTDNYPLLPPYADSHHRRVLPAGGSRAFSGHGRDPNVRPSQAGDTATSEALSKFEPTLHSVSLSLSLVSYIQHYRLRSFDPISSRTQKLFGHAVHHDAIDTSTHEEGYSSS